MDEPAISTACLLTAALPDIAVALLAPVALAIWVLAVDRLSDRRTRLGRLGEAGVRLGAGWLALTFILEGAGRWIVFSTPWPIWLWSAGGALAVETVRTLYALERRAIQPRWGRWLVALRIALVLALLVMLLQPVRIWETRRVLRRGVAILIDGSASMQVADSGMSPGEKLRLAEQLAVPGAERRVRLDRQAMELGAVRQEFGALADELAAAQAADGAAVRRVGGDRDWRRRLLKSARQAQRVADELVAAPVLTAFPAGDPRPARLKGLADSIRREGIPAVSNRLAEIEIAATNRDDASVRAACRDTLERLRHSAAALADAETPMMDLAYQLDDAVALALTGTTARAIEAAVSRRRCDLALELLHAKPVDAEGRPGGMLAAGLLRKLEREYGVRCLVFDSRAGEVDPERVTPSATNLFQATPSAGTDLSAALASLSAADSSMALAGVLLFSDGRHLAPASVDAAVRPLTQKGVPVFPVVMGGWRRPPVDAGIIGLTAPESVRTNDRVRVAATLKCDGLKGSNVQVRLYRDALCVTAKTVRVESDSLREPLSLSDEPCSNGLFRYRLEVDAFAGEVTLSNNQASAPVMATDAQIRLLLVESRPRWEFRYLKNLFSGRDRSVRLQHVLLRPDSIRGLPPQPPVAASVTRPESDVEATALPATPEEWMKFDVVILGDIAPAAFTNNEAAILDRFVRERGGMLVFIAGPSAMPHAWAGTPLAALLPVRAAPADVPRLGSPEAAYRVKLTADGRAYPWLRLSADAAESEAIWNRLPPCYWRHAAPGVKAGATVLLYAQPDSALDAARRSGAVPDEETLRLQREFEESHALLVAQPVGLGQTVYFGFDQTWRLRYWTGDTWHHTLWGQLVRWGGGEKLVSGDLFARLGSAQLRVAPGQKVRIQARLLKPDFTPRTDADAEVEILKDGQPVSRGRLAPVAGRAGLFEREFDALPEGDYRVTLREEETGRVQESGFSVWSDPGAELAELAADRGLLGRLASQTGGRLVEAWRLEHVQEGFLEPTETVTERRQWDLWDSGWLYALVLALGGAEWAIRKKAGLV